MIHRRALGWIFLLILPVILGGCPFSTDPDVDPPPPPPVEYKARTSAQNLLDNLITSYEERNYEEYIKLLSDDFEFFFTEQDAGNDSLDIPVSWPYADEIRSARGLFESPDVEEIKLDFLKGEEQVSDIPEVGDTQIIIQNILLEVTTRLPSGEPLFTQAEGQAKFYFEKTEETTNDGDNIWVITRWEDRTINQ